MLLSGLGGVFRPPRSTASKRAAASFCENLSRGFLAMSGSDYLDQTAPDNTILALLGSVNFTWAQLDLISSGALASLLKIDPAELGITIGRIETQAKIGKMHSIVRHRRDKKLAILLADAKKELTRLRPTRNAVTHGAYIGKSGKGELCFKLPAEFIVDDGQDTAQELFVFTSKELEKHVMDVTKVAIILRNKFDSEEMRKLFDLPGRVRPTSVAD
jgi:hypothetical protein